MSLPSVPISPKVRQTDFEISYVWDRLIEHYTEDVLTDGMFDYQTKNVTDNQLALVQIALQPRSFRAALAKSLLEFLTKPELKVTSRVVVAYENTAFVFLVGDSNDRETRTSELSMRCMVIRSITPNVRIVVGIAMDRPGSPKVDYSADIAYLNITEWTEDLENEVQEIQSGFGSFLNSSWKKMKSNEG